MTNTNSILGLKLPTDPRWVDIARKNIEEILVDHAYCEQKAASTCISLIVQYPQHQKLVEILTPVVAEEWNHFERVLEQLNKRGYALGLPRKDLYVTALHENMRKGGSKEQRLVEKLLVSALIEARSCERFKLLSQEITDSELQEFYHELMVSEAGHYKNFIQLAQEYYPREKVLARWKEWLHIEAQIMKDLEIRSDRMH